jgi:N-acetyl-1-D-myo-inositol-2-amino-2-deoxy-alpha-D-glucopyranoside deacetylase
VTGAFVAVVAHPDDESLIAGGTLALAAAAGADVGVVSLTRGESGPGGEGESLGEIRERELEAAGRALGAQWTKCLHHPDGELEWSDHDAIARELADLLRARRPHALLTFGPDGLYWHPDHIATCAIAGAAADLLDADGAAPPVWLYESAWPPDLAGDLVAAARARGLATGLWGIEPAAFGSTAGGPAVVVDVRSALAAKLAALRAHRTQIGPDHLLAALPDDLADRFLGEERWRVVRPAGSEGGPLARLTPHG